MTLAKRLLLGTAAAFVATSGAHAADLGLPVAPSVDYVQICSIGSFTGFLLPGSDVCFDISGYARGQLTWTEEIDPYVFPTLTDETLDANINALGLSATYVDETFASVTAALGTYVVDLDGAGANTTVVTVQANSAAEAEALAGGGAASATAGLGNELVAPVTAVAESFNVTAAGASLFGGAFSNGDTIIVAGLDALLESTAAGSNNDEMDFLGNARLNFDARTMTEYGLLRGFIRLDGENGTAANVDRAFVQLNVGSLGFTAGLADSVFDPVFTGYGPHGPGLGAGDEASNQFSVNAAVGNGVTVSLSVEDDDDRQSAALATMTEAGSTWTFGTTTYDSGASMPDFVAAIRVDQAWGSAKINAALHEVNPAGSAVDSEWGYAIGASAEVNLPIGVGSTFGAFGIYTDGATGFMGFDNEIGNAVMPLVDASIVTVNGGTAQLVTTEAYVVGAGFEFGLSEMVAIQIDGSYADVDHAQNIFDGNLMTIRGGVSYTPVNNLTLAAGVTYQSADFNTSDLRSTAVDDDVWSARFRVTRSF